MIYYSTNQQSATVDFREATLRGQAPDKGLYFPSVIPRLESAFLSALETMDEAEIAFRVIRPYIGQTIPEADLYRIVSETVSFPIPLVPLTENISALELFHGPTLAFKDVGARFMSRCLGYFAAGNERKITVLVATSGDTGGAVADGFYGVEGVDVVILYPSGMVSPVQEKQLTTPGRNIQALEVSGSFDDCQAMVKNAFADRELREKLFLTSANSINVARWLPQQFYYFFAHKQWKDRGLAPVISVPSGNFGNICAGILAMQSGLPVRHFIAACNVNDVVSDYLITGILQPKNVRPTLSNAMDVGNPSNFVRILEIFGQRLPSIREHLSAVSVSDAETLATIKELYLSTGYTADPHGAVGYLGLKRYLEKNPAAKGYFLETAHPVKFPGAVEKATGNPIPVPAALAPLMSRQKKSIKMGTGYSELREYLWNKS